MMQDYEIINADCLRAMQEMPDGCVDAIVTDPPYGLGFMGVAWDTYKTEAGRSKGGSRTNATFDQVGGNHHPTCAADQARTRKSENEKLQASMIPIFAEALRVAKPGAHMLCFGGTRTFHRMACAIEDADWEIRDTIMWVYGSGFPKSMDVGKKLPEWQGWGTCLKPAWEPIIVARKPLDGTVAHNVMTHGTGAINIDGCRVPTNDRISGGAYGAGLAFDRPWMHDEKAQAEFIERKMANYRKSETMGRFPASLVHDGSQEVLELFPNDSGRFFYCAKASKRDRGEGNDHPTVKPNALMRWLVRLVCPQGGTVLDPFMGSGSTGVACIQEGMRFVGVEMDEHYCEIAEKRIGAESLPDSRERP